MFDKMIMAALLVVVKLLLGLVLSNDYRRFVGGL